jgi:hypothetical protein
MFMGGMKEASSSTKYEPSDRLVYAMVESGEWRRRRRCRLRMMGKVGRVAWLSDDDEPSRQKVLYRRGRLWLELGKRKVEVQKFSRNWRHS